MHYRGTFSWLQTVCRASSPRSLAILTRRSTASKIEFQRVWFGRMSASPQASSTASADITDRPALFQRPWHLPKAALEMRLYAASPSAESASTVATSCSVWQAHRWCRGRSNSPPSSSARTRCTSVKTAASSSSSSSSSSLPSSSPPSRRPKTENAFTKFEPLSVVVTATFRTIPYWRCTSSSAPARTSKVCEPRNLRHARAADLRPMVAGSIQWTVTPMYDRFLDDQQSVVVATQSTDCSVAHSDARISTTLVCSLVLTVARHGTDLPGCRPVTSRLKAGSSTVLNGSSPSTIKSTTRWSTVACDTQAAVFTHCCIFSCLGAGGAPTSTSAATQTLRLPPSAASSE